MFSKTFQFIEASLDLIFEGDVSKIISTLKP